MKKNYESVQTRFGLVQEFAAMYFVGMLQNISIYPYERDVFQREKVDGAYSVEAFLLSYTLLELPYVSSRGKHPHNPRIHDLSASRSAVCPLMLHAGS